MFNPMDAKKALNNTILVLQESLHRLSTAQAAQTHVEGGRSILAMICHMRDYERVIQQRVWLMTQEEHPVLPPLHGEEVSHHHDYSHEEFLPALAEFIEARADTLIWLDNLRDEDWRRGGAHANLGRAPLCATSTNWTIPTPLER